MQCSFVYKPKSGDRVFAGSVNGGVYVFQWANGCRHIVGGVCLTYPASMQGAWWRSQAHRMASLLCTRFGGIAWDEQGTVSLVVPVQSGLQAHQHMAATSRLCGGSANETPDPNEVQLLLAGWEPHADSLVPGYFPAEETRLDRVEAREITHVSVSHEGEVRREVIEVWAVMRPGPEAAGPQKVLSVPRAWGWPKHTCVGMRFVEEVTATPLSDHAATMATHAFSLVE
jgi:hypothetical protein